MILARALYDNNAEGAHELSFLRGDILTVLQQELRGSQGGWWLCSCRGVSGLVPANRVEIIGSLQPPDKPPYPTGNITEQLTNPNNSPTVFLNGDALQDTRPGYETYDIPHNMPQPPPPSAYTNDSCSSAQSSFQYNQPPNGFGVSNAQQQSPGIDQTQGASIETFSTYQSKPTTSETAARGRPSSPVRPQRCQAVVTQDRFGNVILSDIPITQATVAHEPADYEFPDVATGSIAKKSIAVNDVSHRTPAKTASTTSADSFGSADMPRLCPSDVYLTHSETLGIFKALFDSMTAHSNSLLQKINSKWKTERVLQNTVTRHREDTGKFLEILENVLSVCEGILGTAQKCADRALFKKICRHIKIVEEEHHSVRKTVDLLNSIEWSPRTIAEHAKTPQSSYLDSVVKSMRGIMIETRSLYITIQGNAHTLFPDHVDQTSQRLVPRKLSELTASDGTSTTSPNLNSPIGSSSGSIPSRASDQTNLSNSTFGQRNQVVSYYDDLQNDINQITKRVTFNLTLDDTRNTGNVASSTAKSSYDDAKGVYQLVLTNLSDLCEALNNKPPATIVALSKSVVVNCQCLIRFAEAEDITKAADGIAEKYANQANHLCECLKQLIACTKLLVQQFPNKITAKGVLRTIEDVRISVTTLRNMLYMGV